MKTLIKETLYNSTAQAIIKIIETPHYILKAFLFLCVIVMSFSCSYLIIVLIVQYLSFDVSTTSRTLYETPATFPKITICNTNQFTTEYAIEFLKNVTKNSRIDIDIFNETQMSQLNFGKKIGLISLIHYRAILEMNGLSDTEKKKLSHRFDDIKILCFFNAQQCSSDDFSWYFDPWHGNCWQFNTGGLNDSLKTSSHPGQAFGFYMFIYVNFNKNLTKINSFNGNVLGAIVNIGNSSYLTNSQDDILLQAGQFTRVSTSRSFKSNLPRPYSNCVIDNKTNTGFHSELFDLIQNSPYRYTQPFCFWQCTQRFILNECNCTDSSKISLFSNVSQCLTLESMICQERLYAKTIHKDNFIRENCFHECPLECYLDQFDASLSSAEYLPQAYLEFVNSNPILLSDFAASQIDLETARKSFVSFNIFYKSLSYEHSSESPQVDVIWLLIGLGGYLSLFMGVSVFSLFEPIQILIEILFMKQKNHIEPK